MSEVRRWWWALLALVVVLGGATGGYLLQRPAGQPVAAPTATPSPDPVRTPLLQPASASARIPTTGGLRRALTKALADTGLGARVGVSVVDALTGGSLLEVDAQRAVTPASTAKIATAVAVLTVLPADRTFTTTVVQGQPGDVVLVGAGDPTLAGRFPQPGFPSAARLADLAAQLKGLAVRRVLVDDSLFSGPRTGPGWKPGYVSSGDVAPVSALAVDEGRVGKTGVRSADPALEAGRQLAALLHVKPVLRGSAPAGASVLARVQSPTVSALVESMLTHSDNDLAEALGRQAAMQLKLAPTFAGEAGAIATVLGPLLDDAQLDRKAVVLQDASGLSPLDRLEPAALSRLLGAVARDQRFGPVLSGLPVAGFDGTLAKRYRKAPALAAAGEVRAKTGTLNGVSALAGLVRTADGRLLAFDLTADGVSLTGTLAAQAALDQIAAVLASCGCT